MKEYDDPGERIRWFDWLIEFFFSAVYAFMMAYANLLYIILSEYRPCGDYVRLEISPEFRVLLLYLFYIIYILFNKAEF